MFFVAGIFPVLLSLDRVKIELTARRTASQAACDPLQNGLLSDRPQRHKVSRFRIS